MVKSVCMFGDSVAKGVVFDPQKGRHGLLKACFVNLVQERYGFSVKNHAKFGCTITKGKEILEKHRTELSGFDYVGLEFGGNDCDFDWAAVSQDPGAAHTPNTPVDQFERTYGDLLRRIQENNGNPILLSLPPIDPDKYFAWISRGLDADRILRFLGDAAHIYRWHEMYNLAVSRLSASFQIPLIDITTSFLIRNDFSDLICQDGIHPSEKGHALIASQVEAYIEAHREHPSAPMLTAI